MTTYQDPPLQSRRAARQGERAAAYGQQPEQAPEPLTYATQNRPPVPQYGGPDFRARRTPEAESGEPTSEQQRSADQPATQLLPRQEVPSYRPRDFSPEGRRAVHPDVPAEPSAPPAVETSAIAPIEHTMTRRELRALREAQGVSMTAPVAAEAPAVAEAPVAPASPVVDEPVALIEPKAPTASAAPVAPELSPFEALFAPPSVLASAAPAVQDITPDPIVDEPVAPAAEQIAEASVPETTAEAPVAEALFVAPTTVEPAPAAAAAPVPAEPAPAPPAPAGHWSTQAQLDDATQVNESTISRSVGAGSGVITTSALVLPSLPNPEFGHLGTGEILVTGSIGLPHSLATSGAHPTQLDEHHLDHELDPGDHQVVSTDSQPVRAIKAISSHTSTRDVIVAKKRSGNRVLTALIISAAAMAAVVVTLLVVGLVSGVL